MSVAMYIVLDDGVLQCLVAFDHEGLERMLRRNSR
jgi:hypothetical protein